MRTLLFANNRSSAFTRKIALSLALSVVLPLHAAEPSYDDMVRQARDGHTENLLNYLRQQEQVRPLNANQVADWLQVANWTGRDKEVISVWERYSTKMKLPARADVAAARAYRNQKQWSLSLAAWESAGVKEPHNDDILSGRIMTMADARQFTAAESQARQFVARSPSTTSYQTLAWVLRAQGKNWEALSAATLAEEASPDNAWSQQFLMGQLAANRVSAPALEIAQSQKTSPEMQRRLRTDAAAQLVRNSFSPTRNEQERYLVADQALREYDQMMKEWRNDPTAKADYDRARIDRMGALLARRQLKAVTDEYEALVAEGKPVPEYARRWVATAYLAQQRPAEAEVLMKTIFEVPSSKPTFDPTSLTQEDQQSLFYSRMENEDYSAAKKQVDVIVARTPWQRRIYGSPVPEPNDYWLLGQTLQAQYSSMTNDLAQAEVLTKHMAYTAPGNQGLRILYASVLEARGLPRKAERELKLAEVIEPTNLELERQQASVALDLQEWRQAGQLIDDVQQRSPEDEATKRLVLARQVHEKSELRISGHQGIDSDSPISGQHDFNINSAVYGPPMGENVRLFAGFNFATGEFEEGKGYDRDVLGGLEWRSRNWWAEAEISHRNFTADKSIGARFSTSYDINDNWLIGGSAERLSASTPLRALRSGVTSNGGNAFVRWYQNERREYALSVAPSWFSDGNERMEYLVSGKERLWTAPRFIVDFTPSVSASTNTKENVPYYNPKQDLSLVPAFTADHQLYRHYDTIWSQQFVVAVGAYFQQDFDTGSITTLGYGQRLQLNNVLDSGFMLTWDKRPYDGVRERNIAVSFDVNYRF